VKTKDIAPSLQSGASQAERITGTSLVCIDEVIPHHYGTHEKDASRRATEGLHGEADAGGGTDTATDKSGCLGCTGVDGEQLGSDPGTHSLPGADAGVGSHCSPSPDRARDLTGESLGQQEAGRILGYLPYSWTYHKKRVKWATSRNCSLISSQRSTGQC
jgi:hypothetical protein